MASLGKIVYLTEAQKNDLFNFGSVTSNNKTITYSPNDLYLTPDGSVSDVKIGDTSLVTNNVATIPVATTTAAGLLSATDKTKLDGIATGATANTGTITGITMNGVSKGTSGVINLGTVITAHQDISGKVNKTNAEFENSVSMGRKADTTIGSGSVAMGVDVEASANSCYAEGGYTTASAQGAHAEGSNTTASGEASHAEGYYTIASGNLSHAEGDLTVASGVASHAEGIGTTAAGALSHAGGIYNVEDSYNTWPEWTANTSYAVGDRVKITDNETVTGYICKTANTDATFTSSNWTNRQGQMNYAEIIGNGTADNARSNARALDWDGNEYLKGDLYVNCNSDSSGGTKILTAINNKADDNLVVHLSGSESITGTKAMTGTFVINNDASTPLLHFRGTNNSSASGYISLSGAGSNTANTYGNSRFDFVEYSPTSTGNRSSYTETYRLPAVNTDINNSVAYNILTSKTAVTIAQGGTGGTTKAEAQTNLGISVLGTVTRSSNTSTLKKWYTSLPGGLKIAVVEKQVSITTGTSGSVYWKNVPAETWPVTFTAAPIVFTDTRSSDTNGWSWGYTSAPTTTSTGTIAVARGTDVEDKTIFVKWLGIGY